jgi:integrase/recombinase XerD
MIDKKTGKRESKLPVEVNEDEFIELMEATNKIHHKIAFLLAWESGLRISEVINLKPEHINEKDKLIFILEGKGCKDRYTNLPIDWMPHLMKYIPIKCSIRALQASFMLYATKTGLKAKKPTVHFHSLRHGYATHCVRQGVKLPFIQVMLGHTDLATTSVYLRVAPLEAANEVRDKW